MPLSHVQLIGRLLGADPEEAACEFRTDFADGERGESGSLIYVSRDRWITDVDHGGRTVSTPYRSSHSGPDGEWHTEAPLTPSFTSPLALLLPRYAAIHGRVGDDWIVDDADPVGEEDGMLRVRLRHTEQEGYGATALVHPTRFCVTSFRTPAWTARLEHLRFTLDASERALAHSLLDVR
ncbi:hypothetical protein ACIQV3_39240 [Streptomyces sp. NPDC099050]|uniref:hypothetical protein n=1 Tax=Streptomyces sp. NPDC099050 TaxID=3366100 RepID=UPI003807537F